MSEQPTSITARAIIFDLRTRLGHSPNLHTWIRPRPGGLEAKARQIARRIMLPGRKVYEVTSLEAEQDDARWQFRFCLICGAPNTADIVARGRERAAELASQ